MTFVLTVPSAQIINQSNFESSIRPQLFAVFRRFFLIFQFRVGFLLFVVYVAQLCTALLRPHGW